MAGTNWKRLADYVLARRVALGYQTRTAFAEAVPGVSERTIAQIELGHSVRGNTLAAVEVALRWKPGSARSVLDGGDPIPEGSADPSAWYIDPLLQRVYDAAEGLPERDRHSLVALAKAMRRGGNGRDERRA